MKLKAIFICAIFLALTVTISCVHARNDPWRGITDSSEFDCKRFNKQIQIFRPQGVVITQSVLENVQSLKLKVYINAKYQANPSCDISADFTFTNRTQTLTTKHASAIVRAGDIVQYTVSKLYQYGPAKIFSCEFYVNDKFIKSAYETTSSRFCPENVHNFAAEKTLLEETINELLSSCEAVNLTTKLALTDDMQEKKPLKRYAVQRLNTLLPSVNWYDTVGNVSRIQNRIVFDVDTKLMKLKILHMIRGTDVAKNITDLEEPRRSVIRTHDIHEYSEEMESTTEMIDISI
uniref:CBM39 domain-containing protein n=1 Tax=Anopheles funestus TaxID=62324 RepID=A0A4Y0BLY8_ANOFN